MTKEWIHPWDKEDYELHGRIKYCSRCARLITYDESFWRSGDKFYHAGCVRYGCGLSPFLENHNGEKFA